VLLNCYSKCDVNGVSNTGGLTGFERYAVATTCYASGYVIGTTNVGGLFGNDSGTTTNCYYNKDISGKTANEAGADNWNDYGTPLVAADMNQQASYTGF